MTLHNLAARAADGLWDTISGDCFGMTPDPWVCDERQTCTHRCREYTGIVADAIEAALRAVQATERARLLVAINKALDDLDVAALYAECQLAAKNLREAIEQETP